MCDITVIQAICYAACIIMCSMHKKNDSFYRVNYSHIKYIMPIA